MTTIFVFLNKLKHFERNFATTRYISDHMIEERLYIGNTANGTSCIDVNTNISLIQMKISRILIIYDRALDIVIAHAYTCV